jgi:hypothetical protein
VKDRNLVGEEGGFFGDFVEVQVKGLREATCRPTPVLTESIGQQYQVAQIPGEPIQAPHEHIRHGPLFHHGQQLLEARLLEVLAPTVRGPG